MIKLTLTIAAVICEPYIPADKKGIFKSSARELRVSEARESWCIDNYYASKIQGRWNDPNGGFEYGIPAIRIERWPNYVTIDELSFYYYISYYSDLPEEERKLKLDIFYNPDDEKYYLYEPLQIKPDSKGNPSFHTIGRGEAGALRIICEKKDGVRVPIEEPNQIVCMPWGGADEYNAMLEDLFSLHRSLILKASSFVTAKRVAVQSTSDESIHGNARLRLNIVMSFLKTVEDSLEQISKDPKSMLKKERKRLTNPDILPTKPDGRTLIENAIGARVTVPHYTDDFDIYEHRIIRQALETLRRRVKFLSADEIYDFYVQKDISKSIDYDAKVNENNLNEMRRKKKEWIDANREFIKTAHAKEAECAQQENYVLDNKHTYIRINGKYEPEWKPSIEDGQIVLSCNYYYFKRGDNCDSSKVNLALKFATLSSAVAALKKLDSLEVNEHLIIYIKDSIDILKDKIPNSAGKEYDWDKINVLRIDGVHVDRFDTVDEDYYADALYALVEDRAMESLEFEEAQYNIQNDKSPRGIACKKAIENAPSDWKRIEERIDCLLLHTLIKDIRTRNEPFRPTQIFTQDRRYRSVWEAIEEMDKGTLLFDNSMYAKNYTHENYPVRPVHEIYEYWCFYKMLYLLIDTQKWSISDEGNASIPSPIAELKKHFIQIMEPRYERFLRNRKHEPNLDGFSITLTHPYKDSLIRMEASFNKSISLNNLKSDSSEAKGETITRRPDYRFKITGADGTVHNLYVDAKFMPYEKAKEEVNETAKKKYYDIFKGNLEHNADASFIVHPVNVAPHFGGEREDAFPIFPEYEKAYMNHHRIGIITMRPSGKDIASETKKTVNSAQHFLLLMEMFLEFHCVGEPEKRHNRSFGYERVCWNCGESIMKSDLHNKKSPGIRTIPRLTTGRFLKWHHHCDSCGQVWVSTHCKECGKNGGKLIKHVTNYHTIDKDQNRWYVICPKCGEGDKEMKKQQEPSRASSFQQSYMPDPPTFDCDFEAKDVPDLPF